MSIQKTGEDRAVDAVVYIFTAVVFVACLYPFYLSVVLALNEGKDTMLGGIYFWPRKFTLDNFAAFVNDPAWINALWISFSRTVVGTVVTVFFTTLCAYGLSYRTLALRKVYLSLVIFAMYFHGGIIPLFVVLRSLGLTNNYLVYILPAAVNLFFVLVSISFFQTIPTELAESARLDGASEFTIFVQIILRISAPLLATIAIFTAVYQWNNWFDTAFFAPYNNKIRTLAYMLMTVINRTNTRSTLSAEASTYAASTVTPLSIQLAAMLVAIAPIVAVYPFFQRYFIGGMMLGSVKG